MWWLIEHLSSLWPAEKSLAAALLGVVPGKMYRVIQGKQKAPGTGSAY